MFQNLFITKDNTHPFFNDIKKSIKNAENYRKKMLEFIESNQKPEINYSKLNIDKLNEINIKHKYEVLKNEDIIELDKEIHKVLNHDKILELVSYMSQFMIKSNVTNYDKLYKDINKDDKINIMIIGSGPVGLFLACYLSLYYNNTAMNSSPRVNIVMFDNRIENSGFRKPYSRQRLFATSSAYLNMIIPKLYCWNKENKESIMVNIFILEYILYNIAINHYNIKMIYENYNWNDYKKIIKKGNFKVVFDCTGGRLQTNVIKNINTKWLDKINLYDNVINRELIVDSKKNLVYLEKDSKHVVNYYFGSMILYYNNMKHNVFKKFDFDIMTKDDLFMLDKIKNKYYNYNDSIMIIRGIKDNMTRQFLYDLLKNYDEYIITFDVWGVYIRHAIKISDVFTINNKKILYIGAGDTILHSHFITGAGLNRTLDFSVRCANMLLFL